MVNMAIIKELEREFGSLTKVPESHPKLAEMRNKVMQDTEANDAEKRKKAKKAQEEEPTDKLVPWNRVNVKMMYRLRKEQGIPLFQMAELLGMTSSDYNQVEKGLAQMKESQFTKLTRIFKVNRNNLIIKHKKYEV